MPLPTAKTIEVSLPERAILEHMVRQTNNPQWLVTRAKILLRAAEGQSNRRMAAEMKLTRNTVRLWRERWQATAEQRAAAAADGETASALRDRIEETLHDGYRSGTPATFTAEQIVQIVAISCEAPQTSGVPVSHWTPKAVAAEAIRRGIVDTISERQVGRFLKRGGPEAALKPVLAEHHRARPAGVSAAERNGV
jgi:transposase